MKKGKKTYEVPKYEVIKFDSQITTARFQSGCIGIITFQTSGGEAAQGALCVVPPESGQPVILAPTQLYIYP